MDLVLANIRQIKNWVLMVQLSIFWLRKIRRTYQIVTLLSLCNKEWERLSGFRIPEQTVSNTQKALGEFRVGTILVAKSHKTAVYQGEKVAHLEVGGPYQATGGMGDTLAGMITGFLAQFASIDYKAVTVAAMITQLSLMIC